jgi:hypothetical protein
LFFVPENKSKPPSNDSTARAKEIEERVNKHLFQTSQKIELNREKMQVETAEMADKGVRPIQREPDLPNGVDFSGDPRIESLVQDLGRDVKDSGDPKSPNDLIQAELFQQDQLQQYSEAYKKEYARQFVENARKAGYEVVLSESYKVLAVKPLRKPAQDFRLFNNGGGSAQ